MLTGHRIRLLVISVSVILMMTSCGDLHSSTRRGGISIEVLNSRRYSFSSPISVTGLDGNIWVANATNNTITEFSARTYRLIALFPKSATKITDPSSISAFNGIVWIAGTNIIEGLVGKTGKLARMITEPGSVLENPSAIAASTDGVWVASSVSNDVLWFSPHTGKLIRRLSEAQYHWNHPDSLAVQSDQVWVADQYSLSVFSARTGRFIMRIAGRQYHFDHPRSISSYGSNIWVANTFGDTIDEVRSKDGALLLNLHAPRYGFSGPRGIVATRESVWVANSRGDSVTEIFAGHPTQAIVVRSTYFQSPTAVFAVGTTLFVTNLVSNSMAVLRIQ